MAEQAKQGRGNPREMRDSDGEEYSEAEEVNIRDLYVPDLDNTPLQRAIRNGMALNDAKTIYRIRCPRLKEFVGRDTLTVFLPEGRLEVPTEPPVDFVANCAPTPFDQPRLLIEAMQSLVQTQPKLTILPGDDIPLVRDRYLTRYELIERLANYVDLCVLYGESVLRHENAQLHGDRDEILRKEMHEDTLMQRISSNMDKLLAHIQRDIKFRKANKKIQYPLPRINPRYLKLKINATIIPCRSIQFGKIQNSKRWKQDPEEKELQAKASQTKWSSAGKRSYIKGI